SCRTTRFPACSRPGLSWMRSCAARSPQLPAPARVRTRRNPRPSTWPTPTPRPRADRAADHTLLINRSQGVVLGFFVFVVLALVGILVFDPSVYASALPIASGGAIFVEIAFLTALIAFIAFVGVGVVRRWRWMFWLIVVAF